MVIDDFNVDRARLVVGPFEADTPVPVDPDAVLAGPISFQRLGSITRIGSQFPKRSCVLQEGEAAVELARNGLERIDPLASGESCRSPVLVAVHHPTPSSD